MPIIRSLWVAGLVLTGAAQAAVPVLQDGELRLDAAAMLSDGGGRYYRDVVLARAADGHFSVVAAAPRPLAAIHTVQAQLFSTGAVQASVAISGITSVACVVLEQPALTRIGSTFRILLAETVMEPGAVCASLLPNAPFEISLPLEVQGLPAGAYTVDVNGVTDTFVIGAP